jgi:hypothetical protein
MKRLLLLLPLLSFVSLDWKPFAVDQRATVTLPAKPTEAKPVSGKKVGRNRAWMLQAPEGVYQIMRMPTGFARADAAARDSYYTRLIDFTMHNEQGQLDLITAFPTASGTSLEYKYRVLRPGTRQHVTRIVRTLVVDSVAYSLNFIPADKQDSLGVAGAEQRNRFYNSLIVQP